MKKSLAPLIVSFAVIILLTFVVINSRPGGVGGEVENPEEKNVLSLGATRNKRTHQERRNLDTYSKLSPDSVALIEEAKRYLANDERGKAEEILRTVLVFSPSDIIALSLLGRIFFRSGKYTEAEELFKRLASIEEWKNAVTLNHLASTVAKREKYSEAIDLCLKAQELDKGFAEAYLNLSAIYAASGDIENSSKQMLLAYNLIGYGILSYSIDPIFDKARAMPEFQNIIQKAKKDWAARAMEEKKQAPKSNNEQN
jgi:tetratricopeptide (TPR) repeat protein